MVSANGLNHCPARSPMKAIGHEHHDDRERRRRDRQADLVGALVRRGVVVLAHLDVAHDVLAHDDRVVDQDADRQRQAEQRHRVEREAEGPHRDERGQHRDRQRQAGDDRRAPRVEEQEHDEHGEQRRPRPARSRTSATESATRGPASRAITQLDARRQRLADVGDPRSRTRALTSVVLTPSALMMSMPTASRPLNSADVRGSSVPSLAIGDVAEADQPAVALRRRPAARSRPGVSRRPAGGSCARRAAR